MTEYVYGRYFISAALFSFAITSACSRELAETSSRAVESSDSTSLHIGRLAEPSRGGVASEAAVAEYPLTPQMHTALHALAPDFDPWRRDQFSAETQERDSSRSVYGLSVVVLDFNHDGHSDAAVIGRGKTAHYFVAIMSSGSSRYQAAWLEPPGDIASTDTTKRNVYLLKQPSGFVEAPDVFGGPSRQLRLAGDGVILTSEEVASTLYYWESGNFRKTQLGD